MESLQNYIITILPGRSRDGQEEFFDRIDIQPGDSVSIVGSTGSGKSAFINDIEVLAQGDTVTRRTIRINGAEPPEEMVRNPAKKPIVMITQNNRCIADLKVVDFLAVHMKARGIADQSVLLETIELANEFTGEKILPQYRMTALSGGQTRSLFIADAIRIGDAPILLLDEVENAGIAKERVISRIKEHRRAVILVTHDPLLALSTDRRIVMQNGAVREVIYPAGSEQALVRNLSDIDQYVSDIREKLRNGERFSDSPVIVSKAKVTA
ncbi:ATP-binding cassette domain-containing protein [Methanospirillum lacunae]|uniref:ABC transporter ATP-binding protein n=1 Tax=Methanospirillum lacunae TaxID=668570 RepID=A0A2V2MRW1_9EURY|nr:ATP-binding cassette domain-containing protein [Methanospirillum lacunae]PWR70974.1 ABC transporter ATP-binding protein [Methanospirillum lacunae]